MRCYDIEICLEMTGEFYTKKSVELNLPTWGTGIPYHDKRAHARDVSILAYLLVVIKRQFSSRESKRMLLIFFYLKNRKITSLDVKSLQI